MFVSRRSLPLLFAVTLSLACLHGGSASAALPGPTIPDGIGVNIHFTDPQPGEMKMLAAAGFRWVRMDFSWSDIEKTPGQFDFSAYDRLMAALKPYGIRALFILDYSNPNYDNNESPHTPEGIAAFARWAAASVRHFRGRGILWEMYNEPNGGFWKPHADVNQYIALALAVGKAIRAAEPRETYIGPAVSTMDFGYLEACFKAGLLEYWSAVSVHPYRQTGPETVTPDYLRLRAMIDRYAPLHKQIPIISGEWGYSSSWGNMDAAKQGQMLARELLTNLSDGVVLSIWYDWHDDGATPEDPEHRFGTVQYEYHAGRDPVYDPKPAYLAAETLTHWLRGYRFDRRIDDGSPDDYLLLFRRGDSRRLAVWATTPGHSAAIAVDGDHITATSQADTLGLFLSPGPGHAILPLTESPYYYDLSGPTVQPLRPVQ